LIQFTDHFLTSHLERSDAATESTLDPLKRVKVFATVTEDPPEKSATDGKPAAKANNGSEFAPAPKASRTKAKSIHSTAENLMNTSKHPLWYAKVNPKAPFSRGDIAYIEYTRTLVQHCQDAFERGDQEALEKSLTELTERVHSIEFCPALGLTEIKKSHIMERGGLSEIFSQQNAGIFPVYLRADAQCLFSRWIIKDFEPSVLRGIKSMKETFKSGKSRQSNSTLEQDYEFKKSAKVFGSSVLLGKQHIALVNGQWFANRACAYRDGAHGELEAGVCGKKDKGVYSIVLSHAGYADEDEGEVSFFPHAYYVSLTLADYPLLWHAKQGCDPYSEYPASD
jgi:hypothetical protein